ncbi:hypothetical protein F4775DRAFT_542331 [Biscogniauxia sp. FL1348]|nr:hypothetical protein F4775DRAFT_542331 [Biscogniauxia sp. FL1348]
MGKTCRACACLYGQTILLSSTILRIATLSLCNPDSSCVVWGVGLFQTHRNNQGCMRIWSGGLLVAMHTTSISRGG